MHISRGFWAYPLKGGDAKPPVYGTFEPTTGQGNVVEQSNPRTAGLPDHRACGPCGSILSPFRQI